MSTTVTRLVEVLEGVQSGSLSCEEGQSKLSSNSLTDFPKSETILCRLSHYWDDEDIRQRDKEYQIMQDQELNKLIQRLRQSDFAAAADISFLHVS